MIRRPGRDDEGGNHIENRWYGVSMAKTLQG
jgi:hypothetical protein